MNVSIYLSIYLCACRSTRPRTLLIFTVLLFSVLHCCPHKLFRRMHGWLAACSTWLLRYSSAAWLRSLRGRADPTRLSGCRVADFFLSQRRGYFCPIRSDQLQSRRGREILMRYRYRLRCRPDTVRDQCAYDVRTSASEFPILEDSHISVTALPCASTVCIGLCESSTFHVLEYSIHTGNSIN